MTKNDLKKLIDSWRFKRDAIDKILLPLEEAYKNWNNHTTLEELKGDAKRIANGGPVPERQVH